MEIAAPMTRCQAYVSLLTLILAAGQGWSQEARGTILGRLTDSTGAVIPAVSVKITNVATGVTTPAETNAQGNYLAPYLIPGTYRVAAEKTGFKSFLREGIELRVNDRLEVNITLELGAVSETVTVTAETPMLDTASASMGSVVDARRVAELPFPHGNPYHLIQLASGVTFAQNLRLDRPFEPTHIVGYTMASATPWMGPARTAAR